MIRPRVSLFGDTATGEAGLPAPASPVVRSDPPGGGTEGQADPASAGTGDAVAGPPSGGAGVAGGPGAAPIPPAAGRQGQPGPPAVTAHGFPVAGQLPRVRRTPDQRGGLVLTALHDAAAAVALLSLAATMPEGERRHAALEHARQDLLRAADRVDAANQGE